MSETATCIWIEMAKRDMLASKMLAEGGLLELALFHAQQAVEKALKALLAHYGFTIPNTETLRKYKPERLTKFSIVGRYPVFYPLLDEDRELVEIANKVIEYVTSKLRGGCEG